jgi:predicted RecB family nuclease
MGLEHEENNAQSLPELMDLSEGTLPARAERTMEAIRDRVPTIYQGVLAAPLDIDGTSVAITGSPDFILWDGHDYIIRDAKLSGRIGPNDHIQVHRQLAVYGWLFKQVARITPARLEIVTRSGEIIESQPDWNATVQDIRRLLSNRQGGAPEPYSPVGWSKCGACGFRDTHCWPRAVANHEPGIVASIDEGTALALHEQGIRTYDEIPSKFTIDSLEDLVRPFGTRLQKVGLRAEAVFHQIDALQTGDAVILREPQLPAGTAWAVFDVEAIPFGEENPVEVYLWGTQVWADASGPGEYLSSTSDASPGSDKAAWTAFLANVRSIREAYGDIAFVHWAPYEEVRVSEYVARYGDPDGTGEWLLGHLFDLLSEVRFCAVFPLPSYSLKVIEKFVGFRRSQDEYGGDWSIAKYLESHTPMERQEALREIRQYNHEDLQATWAIFQWLSRQKVSVPVFEDAPALARPTEAPHPRAVPQRRVSPNDVFGITDFHAKYFGHELSRRHGADGVERMATVLADAQVDLNPHQIEAALFAFRNPFSKGAILADEVGLGKTIEAGLLLAQKWAERKRHLLVIVPANLRKQWSQELADKFFLPSQILEAKTFNDEIKGGRLNPFDQERIVICSYQFVRTKEPYIRQTPWDLVVIDEAHRLRNVYKKSSKIAIAVRDAVADAPKVLLTATPLQNSLMELYGLVSVIDDHTFGDMRSFRSQFTRINEASDSFAALKERLNSICKRTLRRQVLEYIKFTNRHALVQEFYPSPEEQKLYDLVTEYLQRPTLYALPSGQRHLMTLILRKLLASSSRAIAGTLAGLATKLEAAERANQPVGAPAASVADDFEDLDELVDEWDEGDNGEEEGTAAPNRLSPEQVAELRSERDALRRFCLLAAGIVKDSKGSVLLTALRRGFEAAKQAQERQGAPVLALKAVIFTESRRTQDYLMELLEQTEFAGQAMQFNGTNSNPASRAILAAWLANHAGTDRVSASPTANMRAALVEHFRDNATILIATEAAAEGINLQFCNLVVNYDLPWNPQRIEQRIGRCHRYGQQFDVVVVNFLNKRNAADVRVYELLEEKFKLFNGVFGASDEVLGAVGSGIDFEKRIAEIYQRCRTPQQIQFEFDQLQAELDTEITAGQSDAREKLLDNFDHEVIEKVRLQSRDALDRTNERLWTVTRYVLRDDADFDEDKYAFRLRGNPYPRESIHPGPYRMGRDVEDANLYRIGHPLAQRIIEQAVRLDPGPALVTFDLRAHRSRVAMLEPLQGKSGWLTCTRLTIGGLEPQDVLLFAGVTDDLRTIDPEACRRLFDLSARVGSEVNPDTRIVAGLAEEVERAGRQHEAQLTERHAAWFDGEMDKLDRWADDRRTDLKASLDDLDRTLKEERRGARNAPNLPDKLRLQKDIRLLETKRSEAWRAFDEGSRAIDREKEALLDDIARRLDQNSSTEPLFTLRWEVV